MPSEPALSESESATFFERPFTEVGMVWITRPMARGHILLGPRRDPDLGKSFETDTTEYLGPRGATALRERLWTGFYRGTSTSDCQMDKSSGSF